MLDGDATDFAATGSQRIVDERLPSGAHNASRGPVASFDSETTRPVASEHAGDIKSHE